MWNRNNIEPIVLLSVECFSNIGMKIGCNPFYLVSKYVFSLILLGAQMCIVQKIYDTIQNICKWWIKMVAVSKIIGCHRIWWSGDTFGSNWRKFQFEWIHETIPCHPNDGSIRWRWVAKHICFLCRTVYLSINWLNLIQFRNSRFWAKIWVRWTICESFESDIILYVFWGRWTRNPQLSTDLTAWAS